MIFFLNVHACFRESVRVSEPANSCWTKGEIVERIILSATLALPACDSRNDRLFINDLSLSTSWVIIRGSSEVSRSNLPIRGFPVRPFLFPSTEGPWHLGGTVARGSRESSLRIPYVQAIELPLSHKQNGLRHDSSNVLDIFVTKPRRFFRDKIARSSRGLSYVPVRILELYDDRRSRNRYCAS